MSNSEVQNHYLEVEAAVKRIAFPPKGEVNEAHHSGKPVRIRTKAGNVQEIGWQAAIQIVARGDAELVQP